MSAENSYKKLMIISIIFLLFSLAGNIALLLKTTSQDKDIAEMKDFSGGTIISQCDVCTKVYRDIKNNYLPENPTDAQIEEFLKLDYCSKLPAGIICNKCEYFIYHRLFKSSLKAGLSPEEFCKAIGECN